MVNYHLTNKAVEDLTNIWEYTIDTWSEQQADGYYKMLVAAFKKISEYPRLLGIKYEEVIEGLRGYKTGKHIIFYQILADGDVLIIRILHQRMDLKRRILED